MTRSPRARSAAVAIALGLGAALVAARASPLPAPPLYDGVVVDEPYVWLDPPPGHPGNPTSASATIPVKGGESPLIAIATKELTPQAQLFAAPGALVLPPGTTALEASITAVEPQAPLPDGQIDGNVYRIAVVNQAGIAVTAPESADVTVIMRAVDPNTPTATMERFAEGVWTPLTTAPEGLGAQFRAIVTRFGDFALVLPGEGSPVPSIGGSPGSSESLPPRPTPSAGGAGAGSASANVTLYAGIAIAIVLAGLVATAFVPRRRGRAADDRGWTKRPPPRTRR